MKLNLFFLIFLIISVTGCSPKYVKNDQIKTEIKTESISSEKQVNVGWSDMNTYTVKAVSENTEKALLKAKHQILQDIVKIRMLNESRFTDITKINAEFEKPLKEGKVISEKKIDNNVEIYFQITDEGLKQKFEKK